MAGVGACYEGKSFRLRVAFSDRYPLEPPEVVFLAPAPVHPVSRRRRRL
jgi:ubiquitin-conjugating enzyme E2 W